MRGRRDRAARRYPWPVTPEELSTAIVGVLTTLSDEGALTLPDGVPATVTVERPRQQGHGDYATNVALQLAKKAGTNPRALAELRRRRGSSAADGIAKVDIAGPGFLNITVEAGAQGEVAARDRRGRGGVRHTATPMAGENGSTSSSSRPTRPGRCTSAAPGGRRSATRSPDLRGRAAPRSPGSTTSTTTARRSTGSARSLLAPRRGAGRFPRTATAATTSPRSPTRSSPSDPEIARPARRRGAGGLPRATASTLMFDGDQAERCTTSGSTSTSTSTRTTCTRRGAVERAIDRLTRAGPHLRAGRRAVAARRPSSATTRTG